MEKRYTVKTYAAATGISQQAAYKRIKRGQLQTVKENGVLYILDDSEVESGGLNHSTTGLNFSTKSLNHSTGELNRLNQEVDILNQDSTEDSTGEVEKVETVCNHSTDSLNQFNHDSTGDQLIRQLQKQLEAAAEREKRLQAAIEEKDRVIYDLSKKLAEIASGATQNAARQQLLTAAATARQEEPEPETEAEIIEPGADQQQPQRKKGFLARLFGF